jgi:hypothetical protein
MGSLMLTCDVVIADDKFISGCEGLEMKGLGWSLDITEGGDAKPQGTALPR